jgi:hypothetical protein
MYQFFVLLWQMIIKFLCPICLAAQSAATQSNENDELPTDDDSSVEADVTVVPVVEDDIVTYPANAPVAGEDDEVVTAIEIKE